ncbi:hypothetical protein [Dactylosporangium salmoneum]
MGIYLVDIRARNRAPLARTRGRRQMRALVPCGRQRVSGAFTYDFSD